MDEAFWHRRRICAVKGEIVTYEAIMFAIKGICVQWKVDIFGIEGGFVS